MLANNNKDDFKGNNLNNNNGNYRSGQNRFNGYYNNNKHYHSDK